MGHDNGSSVKHQFQSYWFFADTLLDSNGNDGFDEGDGSGVFRGTMASTNNYKRARRCVDLTNYVNDGAQPPAKPSARAIFAPGSPDACLVWPAGAVSVPGTTPSLYLFATLVTRPGTTCDNKNVPLAYSTILSKVDTGAGVANPVALSWPVGEPRFAWPAMVKYPDGSNWTYVMGIKGGSVVMARVPAASIENKDSYEYLTATGWKFRVPLEAKPLFGGSQPSLAYNTYFKRFLVTYACGFGTTICARTTLSDGSTEQALSGGWSDEVVLYTCPASDGLGCYFPYQHVEYAKGNRIFVSTSRLSPIEKKCDSDQDCRCTGSPAYQCEFDPAQNTDVCPLPLNLEPRYSMTLHEIAFKKPGSPIHKVHTGALGYSPARYCIDQPVQGSVSGTDGLEWSYRQLKDRVISNLSFDYEWNWAGSEWINTPGGLKRVPRIDQDTSVPGPTAGALRVWKPEDNRSTREISISGEVRQKFSCGDGVRVEILRLAANGTIASTLWFEDMAAGERIARHGVNTSLNAGESLGFLVKKAGTTALCDDVVWNPVIEEVR